MAEGNKTNGQDGRQFRHIEDTLPNQNSFDRLVRPDLGERLRHFRNTVHICQYRDIHCTLRGRALGCSQGAILHWRKIASLTMSALSSSFRAHYCVHSEKSAISLSLKLLLLLRQPRLARNQHSGADSVRPMHLFGLLPRS